MNTFEKYLRTLAAELRGNGLSEPTVADVLNEVASDPKVDQSEPESTLGTPKEFASGYEKKPARSAGFKIISVAAVVALVIAGVKVVTSLVLNVQTSVLLTILTYAAAFVVFVIGIAVATRVDRRLPTDLERRFQA